MRGSELLCLKNAIVKPLEDQLSSAIEAVDSKADEISQTVTQNNETTTSRFTEVNQKLTALENADATFGEQLEEVSTTVNEAVQNELDELSAGLSNVEESVSTVSGNLSSLENIIFGLVLPIASPVPHTGSVTSPVWNGYEPTMLTIGGQTSGIEINTYTVIFTPVEPYRWTDGTMDAKETQWTIV